MTCIGIDLGTTNSCISIFRNNKIEIIPNDLGNKITPSCVCIEESNIIVGEMAKCKNNFIYDVKRLIGKKYSDALVQQDKKFVSYDIISDELDNPLINEKYTPQDISAMILSQLKIYAENYLETKITNAVITCPAYFNDQQRNATKEAGVLAGLNVLRIINEPTAAALAYGLDKKVSTNVLIFDFGGGTTDLSILNIDNGIFQVIGTCGDSHLGGDDIDNNIMKHCFMEFSKKHNLTKEQTLSLLNNKKLKHKLKKEAENAKKILSFPANKQSVIYIDNFFNQLDLNIALTLQVFESLCAKELNKCIDLCTQILHDVKFTKDQIDDIVLIGGSTRIPKIRTMLKDFFNKELHCDINPDEAVAHGAGIQGALLTLDENDNNTIKDIVLIDVTPLSLGIETVGGLMSVLIPKNTTIPFTCESKFSTWSDNQPSVVIKIYEGERALAINNNLLGKFELLDISIAPKHVPEITVTFRVDHNGILSVEGKEKNKKNSLVIKRDNKNLIELLADGEKYEISDKKVSELMRAKMSFETFLYGVKNMVICDIEDTALVNKEFQDIVTEYLVWCDGNRSLEEIVEKHNGAMKIIAKYIEKN